MVEGRTPGVEREKIARLQCRAAVSPAQPARQRGRQSRSAVSFAAGAGETPALLERRQTALPAPFLDVPACRLDAKALKQSLKATD